MRSGTAGVVGGPLCRPIIRQAQPDLRPGPASLSEGISLKRGEYVTDEVWQEYITKQQPPEPNDDFHVV